MAAAESRYEDPIGSSPGGTRLAGKIALLVGAGQTPGLTVGNGRAAALLYAREGATVFCVDRDLDSAQETVAASRAEGGSATAFAADVTDEGDCAALVAGCADAHGRIDILHNNVGAGLAVGDAPVTEVAADAFDQVMAVNLRSMVATCQARASPALRAQRSGVILNLSSFAASYSNDP